MTGRGLRRPCRQGTTGAYTRSFTLNLASAGRRRQAQLSPLSAGIQRRGKELLRALEWVSIMPLQFDFECSTRLTAIQFPSIIEMVHRPI